MQRASRLRRRCGQLLRGKTVLGLVAQVGEIPSRPDGPAVACRVRLSGKEAMVQVSSTDARRELGELWQVFGACDAGER